MDEDNSYVLKVSDKRVAIILEYSYIQKYTNCCFFETIS